MAAPKKQAEKAVSLKRIERPEIEVRVKGTAPLIVHRWSEKAKAQMLAKQMGVKSEKELKNPEQDFESSMYRFDDGGHGFPAVGFKAAIVGGARYFNAVTMTMLRQCLHLQGEGPEQLIRLDCSEPRMREDMVRVGMGTADIRYRAEYPEWEALLRISYVPSMIDLDSVIALVDAGGMGGVGEWRPERDGTFGTFEVLES